MLLRHILIAILLCFSSLCYGYQAAICKAGSNHYKYYCCYNSAWSSSLWVSTWDKKSSFCHTVSANDKRNCRPSGDVFNSDPTETVDSQCKRLFHGYMSEYY